MRTLLILCLLALSTALYSQTIAELGKWPNPVISAKYIDGRLVAGTPGGIHFLDVSNPSNPVIDKTIPNPTLQPFAIESDGSYAYFGGGSVPYLMVADVTNMNNPYQTGITTDVSGGTNQIALSGNYVYMPTKKDTLFVIDVSIKSNPQVVARLPLGAQGIGVAVNGNFVYVTTDLSLVTVDASIPSTPVIVDTKPANGPGRIAADFQNQRMFIFSSPTPSLAGFDVVSTATPGAPVVLYHVVSQVPVGTDVFYRDGHVIMKHDISKGVSAYAVGTATCSYLCSYDSTIQIQKYSIALGDSGYIYLAGNPALHILKLTASTSTVGLSQSEKSMVKVAPNPCRELVTIHSSGFIGGYAEIFSPDGRLIDRFELARETVKYDLTDRSGGVYFIRLSNQNRVWHGKFVKE